MTIYMDTAFEVVECGHEDHGRGGFQFAMTRTFYNETKCTGRGWYCPMGHSRVWRGQTTEQKLKATQVREQALKDQLGAAIREAETTRQALVRDRHRFANGVCPCCTRSFENVRRHVQSQHPDYDVKAVASPARFQCSCGSSFETLRGLRTHQGHQRRDGWDSPNASRWAAHLTKV